LRVIKVSSTGDASWPPLAKALAAQRLPSLRELHIQHSSSTGADQLQQLAAILQVCAGTAAGAVCLLCRMSTHVCL
jgi:hypothetical protein